MGEERRTTEAAAADAGSERLIRAADQSKYGWKRNARNGAGRGRSRRAGSGEKVTTPPASNPLYVRRVLAGLLVCLAVLAGPAAHAARQLRAREQPTTQGPLTLSGEQCDEQKLKAGGKPVVAVEFCIFFYTFSPLLEVDLWNDYGVAWAQATFDALPGLCTSEVGFYIEVSPSMQIYGRTPPDPVSAKKTLPVSVELPATANASAVEEGLVSQEFRLLPGKMRPIGAEEEARVGVSWKGRSPAKLALATGAEIAWPAFETPEMRLRADTIRLTSGPGC